jgi:AAA domain
VDDRAAQATETNIRQLRGKLRTLENKADGALVDEEWVVRQRNRMKAEIREKQQQLAAHAADGFATREVWLALEAEPTAVRATDLIPLTVLEPVTPARPIVKPEPTKQSNGHDASSAVPPPAASVILEPPAQTASPVNGDPLRPAIERAKPAQPADDLRAARPPLSKIGPYEKITEPPLPLLWCSETAPALDDVDFVEGVLVEGSAVVVYGDSSVGKTFWTTNLALHVAAGKPWNGRAVEQGAVVYCVMEGGNRFRNRVAAWRGANPGIDLPFTAIPASLNLLNPEADVLPLIETIRFVAKKTGRPVKMVVIDTLARALAGGNENSPEDMGALVRNMDIIRKTTGACVLFVHHSGKDAARGARGHSSLRAAVDTEIEVEVDRETGIRTAKVEKQRDLQDGDVFGFTLETVLVGQNRRGRNVTTCLVNEAASPLTARHTKGPKLNEEAGTLLREIEHLAGREGRMTRPEPDMPAVLTLSRAALQEGLIRRGWLQVSGEGSIPISNEVSTISRGRSSFHINLGTLLKGEPTRLWKRLNSLKSGGMIGFNRHDVWLVKAPPATRDSNPNSSQLHEDVAVSTNVSELPSLSERGLLETAKSGETARDADDRRP